MMQVPLPPHDPPGLMAARSETSSSPPLIICGATLTQGLCGGEVEVCGSDPNRPDLTVCIAGAEHRIRLFMPYPPCGTPEAKAAPRCAEWKIGRPW